MFVLWSIKANEYFCVTMIWINVEALFSPSERNYFVCRHAAWLDVVVMAFFLLLFLPSSHPHHSIVGDPKPGEWDALATLCSALLQKTSAADKGKRVYVSERKGKAAERTRTARILVPISKLADMPNDFIIDNKKVQGCLVSAFGWEPTGKKLYKILSLSALYKKYIMKTWMVKVYLHAFLASTLDRG